MANKFVIVGKNGSAFTSTEPGKEGEEVTFDTYKEAYSALKQIQLTLPFEEFKIEQR